MNDQVFKADGGKIKPDLLFSGMPNALEAVAAVLTYGAQKYEAHSWKGVEMTRYEDALARHLLARKAGEVYDYESGLLHLAHEACNILFLLQDYIDKHPDFIDGHAHMRFKKPPQDHKGAMDAVLPQFSKASLQGWANLKVPAGPGQN